MALGAISIPTVGSIVQPASLQLTINAVLSGTLKDYGSYEAIPFPSLRAFVVSHGIEPMRIVFDSAYYLLGPRAPKTAPTVASTGNRATAALVCASNLADGNSITIGWPTGARKITFKTTLDATQFTTIHDQVKIGVDLATTLANLQKLINNTGTQGTEYWNWYLGYGSPAEYLFSTAGQGTGGADVSVTSLSGGPPVTTANFRAGTFGTVGNAYIASIGDNTGAHITSFGTAGLMTGGTAGTGTAPAANGAPYKYAYSYYRLADGAETAMSPTASLVQASNCNVNQTAFVAPASRDGTDNFRLLRTTVGGQDYYKTADIATGAGEPYVDSFDDSTLIGSFKLLHDDSIARPYVSGYPNVYRYQALYKGSIFGTGAMLAANYTTGTASVTNASATVTLSAAATPKTDWIGRTFQVASDTQTYLIVDVTEATNVLTLNLAFNGSTNAAAVYTVKESRDPFEIYYSVPTLPNNWPVAQSFKGVSSEDPRGCTGIVASYDSLVAFTATGVSRVLGDPASGFRIVPQGEGMGCFCGQAIQSVEGSIYWLGPDGIYTWAASGDPRPLSKPHPTQFAYYGPINIPMRGIQGTIARINLDAVDGIVSDYNPSLRLIRWFVPLDGEPYNNYAIVYDVQTGAFALDTCQAVTAATSVIGPDGFYRTIIGDAFGNIFQLDVSNSDGAYGFEPVQTVSTYVAGTQVLTVTGTPFPTANNGLAGVSITHVSASGGVQRNKIVSNTSSALTLAHPFVTAPVATEAVIVGGIHMDIQTGRFDFQAPEARKNLESVVVDFQPTTSGRLWCAAAADNGSISTTVRRSDGTTVDFADLTGSTGSYRFFLRRGKAVRFSIELAALQPGMDISVVGMVPIIPSRDRSRVGMAAGQDGG